MKFFLRVENYVVWDRSVLFRQGVLIGEGRLHRQECSGESAVRCEFLFTHGKAGRESHAAELANMRGRAESQRPTARPRARVD